MYEGLKEGWHNIVVSGPQRSGTRITAKILAQDTDKDYIDEKYINNHDYRLLEYYLQKGNVVIQCPALCHLLHYITNPDTLVIVVRRPIEDIIASERRIEWLESARFQELYKYGYSDGIISQIKYEFWDSVQKPILGDRGRDIDYSKLKGHSLYIEERGHFKWNQTR